MSRNGVGKFLLASVLIGGAALSATAQSFRVQCPTSTITHPVAANNNGEHTYSGPETSHLGPNGFLVPDHVLGAIKCQQIAGGDGYATMGNGTQTYMFSFGPLSGIADITAGNPGTEFPNVFNAVYTGTLVPGDPATTDNVTTAITSYPYRSNTTPTRPLPPFGFNGAVGLTPDVDCLSDPTCAATIPASGLDGHVDPRQIMDVGVMNGNIPAPLMAIDEDDEFFLTLTNTGMIMRPDLFEQHTVHFHGYPNASSFYDGVPDASVAINIGGSFTYYYLAPDAGTYFWHCHITPPEHLQMGMVGQIYVRPRQNNVPLGGNLATYLGYQNGISVPAGFKTDLRTVCNPAADIVCTTNQPLVNTGAVQARNLVGSATNNPNYNQALKYTYNDGDGTTAYTVEYPIQIHGFDPNFHFVGMTFNPEAFADMKDKFFLLNGRSYPDTIIPGPLTTESADGRAHFSQPLPSIINIPAGGKALIRLSDLDVTEFQTLASLGIPMHVVGYNAKLLRDQSGNNTDYYTNSVTLGGGESLDFILDASNTSVYHAGQIFYLFTPNLDHLSNDQENFGGLMTEIHIN